MREEKNKKGGQRECIFLFLLFLPCPRTRICTRLSLSLPRLVPYLQITQRPCATTSNAFLLSFLLSSSPQLTPIYPHIDAYPAHPTRHQSWSYVLSSCCCGHRDLNMSFFVISDDPSRSSLSQITPFDRGKCTLLEHLRTTLACFPVPTIPSTPCSNPCKILFVSVCSTVVGVMLCTIWFALIGRGEKKKWKKWNLSPHPDIVFEMNRLMGTYRYCDRLLEAWIVVSKIEGGKWTHIGGVFCMNSESHVVC